MFLGYNIVLPKDRTGGRECEHGGVLRLGVGGAARGRRKFAPGVEVGGGKRSWKFSQGVKVIGSRHKQLRARQELRSGVGRAKTRS